MKITNLVKIQTDDTRWYLKTDTNMLIEIPFQELDYIAEHYEIKKFNTEQKEYGTFTYYTIKQTI